MKTTITILALSLSGLAFAQSKEDVICEQSKQRTVKCRHVVESDKKLPSESSIVYKSTKNGVTTYSDSPPEGKHEKLDMQSEKMQEKLSIVPN